MRLHRTAALACAALIVGLSSCSDAAKPTASASASATSEPATTVAPTTTSASATAQPTGPQRLDLSSRGLPVVITVPACVKPRAPLLKNEDNVKDVILACDPEMGSKTPPFAIQVGLAAKKIWKSDLRQNKAFKRFVVDEPTLLRWEAAEGAAVVEEFMVRQKIKCPAGNCGNLGTEEYACFPQFPASAEHKALLEEELAACKSLSAP